MGQPTAWVPLPSPPAFAQLFQPPLIASLDTPGLPRQVWTYKAEKHLKEGQDVGKAEKGDLQERRRGRDGWSSLHAGDSPLSTMSSGKMETASYLSGG